METPKTTSMPETSGFHSPCAMLLAPMGRSALRAVTNNRWVISGSGISQLGVRGPSEPQDNPVPRISFGGWCKTSVFKQIDRMQGKFQTAAFVPQISITVFSVSHSRWSLPAISCWGRSSARNIEPQPRKGAAGASSVRVNSMLWSVARVCLWFPASSGAIIRRNLI
jgi:hypothetical protein